MSGLGFGSWDGDGAGESLWWIPRGAIVILLKLVSVSCGIKAHVNSAYRIVGVDWSALCAKCRRLR